jgi:hypothetical protein
MGPAGKLRQISNGIGIPGGGVTMLTVNVKLMRQATFTQTPFVTAPGVNRPAVL